MGTDHTGAPPELHGLPTNRFTRQYDNSVDWNLQGPQKSYVNAHRTAGSVEMVRMAQPAGHFPDPAMPNLTFIMVVGGRPLMDTDLGAAKRQLRVERGLLSVTPANTPCDFTVHGPHGILIFNVSAARVSDLTEQITGKATTDLGPCHDFFRDPLIEQLSTRMWEEAVDGNPFGRVFADQAMNSLITLLCGRAARSQTRPPRRTALEGHRLGRVLDFVRDNLASDFGLADMASVAHMSEFHFSRQFKSVVGLSPHQYVIRKRVERAKDLIRENKLSLTQVALAVGFCDQSHLVRHFNRLVGVSPSRFH
jgi:AraC family transcriptional regulator